jgi:hypothetical protein
MSDSGLDKKTERMKLGGRLMGYLALLLGFATVASYSQTGELSMTLLAVTSSTVAIALALRRRVKRAESSQSEDSDET